MENIIFRLAVCVVVICAGVTALLDLPLPGTLRTGALCLFGACVPLVCILAAWRMVDQITDQIARSCEQIVQKQEHSLVNVLIGEVGSELLKGHRLSDAIANRFRGVALRKPEGPHNEQVSKAGNLKP